MGMEFVGQDKGSLIKKPKAACRSKGKLNIYSLLLTSRRCPATSWEAQLQYTEQLLQETDVLIRDAPISFLLAITAEQMPYGLKYLKILPPPQPAGEVGMLETALMLWEHCSTVAKTLVC